MCEGRIYAFNRRRSRFSVSLLVSLPVPTGWLHISSSSFFNLPAPGLQGAKSFVRDRNGLRISARASPICGRGSCAGEILKALGGIKEIFVARDASAHPEDLRLLSFFRYETPSPLA